MGQNKEIFAKGLAKGAGQKKDTGGLGRYPVNLLLLMGQGSFHKAQEERVRFVGAAFEFGMELYADEMPVIRQFHRFYDAPVRRSATQHHAVLGDDFTVIVVKFIAVAMALVNERLAVAGLQQSAGHNLAGIAAQAHGAAEGNIAILIGHEVDDRVRAIGIELAGVGTGQAADVSGKFDDRNLHAQADAKIGNILLTGIAAGRDHAFDAAFAKAAGH